MLEANRNEIHEVYTLCRILGQGYLAMGTADGEAGENVPVALVERQDNDGPRRYLIEGDEVLVELIYRESSSSIFIPLNTSLQ